MEENKLNVDPEVQFYLDARGAFDPAYITRVLEIQPNRAYRKGDELVQGSKARFDSWGIKSPKTRGYEFANDLLDFRDNFRDKESRFRSLIEQDSIKFHITAYISMFGGMQRPEVRFEKTLMQRLIDFGFILDVVIYCECCDSEEEDDDG